MQVKEDYKLQYRRGTTLPNPNPAEPTALSHAHCEGDHLMSVLLRITSGKALPQSINDYGEGKGETFFQFEVCDLV